MTLQNFRLEVYIWHINQIHMGTPAENGPVPTRSIVEDGNTVETLNATARVLGIKDSLPDGAPAKMVKAFKKKLGQAIKFI